MNSFRQFSLINDEDTTDLSTRQNQGRRKTENKHNTIKKTWESEPLLNKNIYLAWYPLHIYIVHVIHIYTIINVLVAIQTMHWSFCTQMK